MLSREAMIAVKPRAIDVDLPELGGTVRLRAVTIATRVAMLGIMRKASDDMERYTADQALPADEREGLIEPMKYDAAILSLIFAIVDENDQLMFTIDDHEWFRTSLDFATTCKLFDAVQKLTIPELPVSEQKKTSTKTRTKYSRTGSR